MLFYILYYICYIILVHYIIYYNRPCASCVGAVRESLGAVCSGEVFPLPDIRYVSDARTSPPDRRRHGKHDRRSHFSQESHRKIAAAQTQTSDCQSK